MEDNWLTDQYFKELKALEPLSREEERNLSKLAGQGDEKAKEKLVLSNLRFVVHIAKEYQNQGLPLQDLISVGNLGMLEAVKRFDEARGFRFITYAVWWVRQAIRQALLQNVRTIRIPSNRIDLLGKLSKIQEEMLKAERANPSLDSLAEKVGVSESFLRETLQQTRRVRSLDAQIGHNEGDTLYGIVADNQDSPEDIATSRILRMKLQKVLDTLDEREAHIIRLYYGIGEETPMTLRQIGDRLHLSRERIRQIKAKALHHLKHSKRKTALEQFIE